DPFADGPQPRAWRIERSPASGWLGFSGDGGHLLWLNTQGELVLQRVPTAPKAQTPNARRFQPLHGAQIVAAGWLRRGGMAVVLWSRGQLWLHSGAFIGAFPFESEGMIPFTPPRLGRPSPLFAARYPLSPPAPAAATQRFLFSDGANV